jgi:hypothetical protein
MASPQGRPGRRLIAPSAAANVNQGSTITLQLYLVGTNSNGNNDLANNGLTDECL